MSLRGTRLGIHLALTLMAWAALSQRTVRADDWLAALPACSFGQTASVPRYELLYPRAGLPALVEAGETLVTRVRLPAPLTPPPGVQQPRALVGWRAELSGHAWPVSPTDMIPQRQALDVVNVRPDSAASLIYRAAVPIPAWVAPGSYDFALWAPGGSAIARGALRVLAPGHAPRLAWIDAAAPPPSMAVAGLPIDAWVCAASSTRTCMSDAAGGGATTGMHDGAGLVAAPILNVGGLVAALRVGRGLWTLGSCEAGGLGLADETRSVLARERRVPFVPAAPSLTPTQFQAFGESARAWPAPDALALERGGEQLHVRVARDFPCALELALLLPLAARPLQLRAGAF